MRFLVATSCSWLCFASACRLFSVTQPCSADTNCPADERCIATFCAPVVADEAGAASDDDAPDDDTPDASVVGELDAGPAAAGEEDAGAADADADAGEADTDAGDGGADAGPEAAPDAGQAPDAGDVVVAAGGDFTVRLLWTADVDLDLHVIQRAVDGRYCRDARKKPRDQGVALGAADLARECGGHSDCGYSACDETGTYDVDWLADGSSAPFVADGEPVLAALDGASGDVRSGDGAPAEEITVATAPIGRYLLAAAHPSPAAGDGPVCARLKVQRQGIGEVFCRAMTLNDFAWDEVAELVVTAEGIDVVPLVAANSCTCP